MRPFFSVITVCLNSGKKLEETLRSVERQTFQNFQVVIKDGLSEDGSLNYARMLAERENRWQLEIVSRRDEGIYDAMNQGVEAAEGSYIFFLNCGDRFYSESVLQEMADFISAESKDGGAGIYYGNIYERRTGQKIASNPRMDAFGCYRNVPCHQACFYSRELLTEHPFVTSYRVRADYEQFLWCFFEKGLRERVDFCYRDMIVADYEGGGFSESRENRKVSAREHRQITGRYLPRGQRFTFRLIMLLTLAPLRTRLAGNERTAGIYNRLKKMIYSVKER